AGGAVVRAVPVEDLRVVDTSVRRAGAVEAERGERVVGLALRGLRAAVGAHGHEAAEADLVVVRAETVAGDAVSAGRAREHDGRLAEDRVAVAIDVVGRALGRAAPGSARTARERVERGARRGDEVERRDRKDDAELAVVVADVLADAVRSTRSDARRA